MDDAATALAAPAPVAQTPLVGPLDPKRLRQQIDQDLRKRRQITDMSADLKRTYAGACYGNYGTSNLENHPFKWVTTVVPTLVFNNPKVRISDMGITDSYTRDQELALNALLPQIDFADELMQCAFDLQFDFGVSMVVLEPTPGLRDQPEARPMRPVLKRISPCVYFRDSDQPVLGHCRHQGHLWVAHKSDLEAMTKYDGTPKYDPQALQDAVDHGDLEKIQQDLLHDGIVIDPGEKDIIVGVTIYLADTRQTVELAFKGEGDAVLLREATEYVGLKDGPYQLYGLYIVPDQIYPLSPLQVTKEQVDEINAHRKQMREDALAAKNLVFIDSDDKTLLQAVKSLPSSSIVPAPGFGAQVKDVQIGGASPEQMAYTQAAGQKLDELSGITGFMKGNVTGDPTATEVAEAGQWADLRVKFAQRQFHATVKKTLAQIVELMDETPGVAFPIVIENPETGERARATYFGGGSELGMISPWKRSYTVEIEPYSFEYTNQVVLRMQLAQAMDMVVKIVQAGTMMPELNVETMLNDYLQTLNIPDAAKRYVRFAVLEQRIMLMQTMQMHDAATQLSATPNDPEAGGPSNGPRNQKGVPNQGELRGRALRRAGG